MEPVNASVDVKPVSYDKLESLEQVHGNKHANADDHGMFQHNDDVDNFLNSQKSSTNGLLDSFHENMSPNNGPLGSFEQNPFHEPNKPFFDESIIEPQPSPPLDSELRKISNSHETLGNEAFCGTDKLNKQADFLTNTNDDVEEFVPSSHIKETHAPPLLNLEPANERLPELDEFKAYTDSNLISDAKHQLENDIIEPASEFKESLPSENLIDIASAKVEKEIGDLKYKEISNDSSRTATPDFLELDQDDLKPIDVKPPAPKTHDKVPEKVPEVKKKEKECSQEKPEIGPKELFSKYGLDIWFKPERLNPTVEAFIYWRDPKLSAIVFVSGLVLLLSMAYYSLISVVANTGLTVVVLAMGFRIYKHVLQAVQKTDQGHPYSVFLELDLKLPQEKVHELVDTVLIHINAYISELRRLVLIENWMESIRFAVVLWVLTYVGSWFNGLTLVIIAFVSLFTLPKVYENNKVQIDQNLALVHAKLEELTNKIKDVLPALLRKKLPEKKE